MTKLLHILTLSYLLILSSCNQTGLGAVHVAKNLVTTPFRGVKALISEYQYSQIKSSDQSAQQQQVIPPPAINCNPTSIFSGPANGALFDDIEELLEETREEVCSCKTWGSCKSDTCSCETLCPDNFDIFKRHEDIIENSSTANSMAFRNKGSTSLSNIKGTKGYCWGHASLTSKFNRLGFFESGNQEARKKLDAAPGSIEREEAINYYKEIIDDIADNKVRKIPGFSSLNEFSDHPDFQVYLADKVAKGWAERAMTFQGLATALSIIPMREEKSQELFNKIKEKIDNNQQPQIVFTKKYTPGYTHTTLVSDYKIIDGKMTLCIRDNNIEPVTNRYCLKTMTINEDGALEYDEDDWGELGAVTLAHNDNADAVAQFNALREHCAKEKDCPLNE